MKLGEWSQKEGENLEFSLVYEGPLYAHRESKLRAAHKHSIRKQFHPQLRKLWSTKLSHWVSGNQTSALKRVWSAGGPLVEQLADHFQVCGYRFVPLVTERLMLACKFDILFLRREIGKGKIIQGGDIDNRLKSLFDAMKVPKECKDIGGENPSTDENPFYCLLEDDSLITDIKVRADTLLTPAESVDDEHIAKLIIGVTLRPLELTEFNSDFA
jgi:hypothetical protein